MGRIVNQSEFGRECYSLLSAVNATVRAPSPASFGDTETYLAISQLIQALLGWLLAIFNVTILTSLYGFFVEGRDF